METTYIRDYARKLAEEFTQAFGHPPRYVYLGGKFLEHAAKELGGRPIVMEKMIVQTFEYDEFGVGAFKIDDGDQ